MTSSIYAIGDIHGDREQLLEAHRRISADRSKNNVSNYNVVHVGDLVDRGPDSKGVLDYLTKGIERDEPWVVLKGNHDRLCEWFLKDAERIDPVLRRGYTWLHEAIGGRNTLRSYGIEVPENPDLKAVRREALEVIPSAHLDFLSSLKLCFETEDYFFAHAGIRPAVPLANQTENDLLWIRHDFLNATEQHPKIIVHGHTPIEKVTHYGNRINIDTGAAWGYKLSTIVIEGPDVWLLDGIDRIPLEPMPLSDRS